VYMDIQDGGLKTSKPKFGEFGSTIVDFTEIIREGNMPLIAAHTHPRDALPSPEDYTPLIKNVFDNGKSLTKEILVICPHIQIAAIASPQTPILTISETEEWLSQWQEEIESVGGSRMVGMNKREEELFSAMTKTYEETIQRFASKIDESYLLVEKGLVTEEEHKINIELLANKLIKRNEHKSGTIKKYIFKIRHRRETLSKQSLNQVLVECARSLNVALYVSDNMVEFHLASA
jgi:hypothetical protein